MWRQRGDVLIPEKDTPGIGRIEAGDIAKKGGLSASAGTEQEKDLTRFDAEVYASQRGVLPEPLHQVLNCNGDHRVSYWLIAEDLLSNLGRGA